MVILLLGVSAALFGCGYFENDKKKEVAKAARFLRIHTRFPTRRLKAMDVTSCKRKGEWAAICLTCCTYRLCFSDAIGVAARRRRTAAPSNEADLDRLGGHVPWGETLLRWRFDACTMSSEYNTSAVPRVAKRRVLIWAPALPCCTEMSVRSPRPRRAPAGASR